MAIAGERPSSTENFRSRSFKKFSAHLLFISTGGIGAIIPALRDMARMSSAVLQETLPLAVK
jgi:hypothetical protein